MDQKKCNTIPPKPDPYILCPINHQPMDTAEKISVDLGCGSNPRNPFNAERLIGVDCHPCNAEIIQCNIGFETLPFNDASIDFATAFDFIEHLPRFAIRERPFNPFIDTMSEIWRILKPNAIFLQKHRRTLPQQPSKTRLMSILLLTRRSAILRRGHASTAP